MPSRSRAQNRYVQAMAAQGKPWAKKWAKEQRGHKVPKVEHVKKAMKKKAHGKHR